MEGPLREICDSLDDWRITHEDQELPEEFWAQVRKHRLFGLIIPKQYSGWDFSAHAHSHIIMHLASRSITAAVTVMVPNSLGPGKLLMHYGSDRQKRHWLPRLARGEEIPCFALTGPTAGSDAASLPDTGRICRQGFRGKETLGILLNWNKRYITLGPVATVIGLAFHLHDPDGLLGGNSDLGITLALIPTDLPGIEIGDRHVPLDIPFHNGPNRGRNVFIPLQWVIGERSGIGKGWPMLMECLAEGRGISLPALASSAAKSACRYTGAYARVRNQFGRPIGDFEGVQEALARIAGISYRMDAARSFLLSALDRGTKPSVASAIVKYQLTEGYRQVINDAMDVQGGSGIVLGPDNWIGRTYQAIPISITVEGANILTRNLIVFGQGSLRAHPYLLQEVEAAGNPDVEQGLSDFDRLLRTHLGWLFGNLWRSLRLGLMPVRSRNRDDWQRQMLRMSSAFAFCADVTLMSLGSALKRRERLSARLGDVLSELYIASALLWHYRADAAEGDERLLFEWAMQDSLWRIQTAFDELWHNLPNRPLAWLMRHVVFPTGAAYARPDDRLDQAVAGILLRPSATRDKLTQGIHLSDNREDSRYLLDRALELLEPADKTRRILHQARQLGRIDKNKGDEVEQALQAHIIHLQEARTLREADRLADRLIQVNAFDDYGKSKRKTHSSAHAA